MRVMIRRVVNKGLMAGLKTHCCHAPVRSVVLKGTGYTWLQVGRGFKLLWIWGYASFVSTLFKYTIYSRFISIKFYCFGIFSDI
jgi:hypothetical protein